MSGIRWLVLALVLAVGFFVMRPLLLGRSRRPVALVILLCAALVVGLLLIGGYLLSNAA